MNTTPHSNHKLVAVSISNSPDLERLGYGQEHLHELMISVARAVLRLPANLAYGGDLRPAGFTETLFLLGRGEHPDMKGWASRLYSFLAWPAYLSLTESQEAELLNTCRFVRVTPQEAGLEDIPAERMPFDNDTRPETAYHRARCLSHMRAIMTQGGATVLDGQIAPAISARILLGGTTARYAGVMPGLFEEYLYAVDQHIPVYILGGFGGSAGILSQALRTTSRIPELEFEYHREQLAAYADLVEEYKKHPDVAQPPALYDRLKACVEKIRDEGLEAMRNGLSKEENEILMTDEHGEVILSLLKKGLSAVLS